MASPHDLANFIWQIADLLRGPYRPPQYERVMLPMTVLRRFDCVLAPTKEKVLREFERQKGKYKGDALDRVLNRASGQQFHNHSPLTFASLKGDPDNISAHLVSYLDGFSANVGRIFEYFDFKAEIERMHEANILYLVVSRFCDIDLHPNAVPNIQMGHIFEDLIRRFNEAANETAGDHFTPREVIRLMVNLLFMNDERLLSTPETVRKLLDPACGTGGNPLARRAQLPQGAGSGLYSGRRSSRRLGVPILPFGRLGLRLPKAPPCAERPARVPASARVADRRPEPVATGYRALVFPPRPERETRRDRKSSSIPRRLLASALPVPTGEPFGSRKRGSHRASVPSSRVM